MQKIGAYAAKSHLSQLLDSVSHGESFAITKHGNVIAFLTPAITKPSSSISKAIMGIQLLRKKIAKRGVNFSLEEIQEMKARGRQ